jgi:hypothetical protein
VKCVRIAGYINSQFIKSSYFPVFYRLAVFILQYYMNESIITIIMTIMVYFLHIFKNEVTVSKSLREFVCMCVMTRVSVDLY